MGNKAGKSDNISSVPVVSARTNNSNYNTFWRMREERKLEIDYKELKVEYIDNKELLESIAKIVGKKEADLLELLQYKIIFQNGEDIDDSIQKQINDELRIKPNFFNYGALTKIKHNEECERFIELLQTSNPYSMFILMNILDQRCINQPVTIDVDQLIYQHYQNIDALHSTLKILQFIGFTTDGTKMVYNNGGYLAFYLSMEFEQMIFKYKIDSNTQKNIRYGRIRLDECLLLKKEKNIEIVEEEKKTNFLEHDHNHNEESYNLIVGFLKCDEKHINNLPFIPLDVVILCMRYIVIPNIDINYKYIWLSTNYDGKQLQVHNIDTLQNYNVNIPEMKHDVTLNLCVQKDFAVKNISFPKWINELQDGDYMHMKNRNSLCAIFKQKMMIIFDTIDKFGYKIKFNRHDDIHKILGYNHEFNTILVDGDGEIMTYNVDTNKYIESYKMDDDDSVEDEEICLFDRNSKIFICGNKCKILSLTENKQCEKSNVSNINIPRIDHKLLYQKEFKHIIVGGGRTSLKMYHPFNTMHYHLKSNTASHIVETFDLSKNTWNILNVPTDNEYAERPHLWYDNQEPYIVKICQNSLIYSIDTHAEFIDMRDPKRWYPLIKIDRYFKQNKQTAKPKIIMY